MAELLVTGGAGFIGANFIRHWHAAHPDDGILVLDSLSYAGMRETIAANIDVRFVHADIRDEPLVTELLDEYRIDTIVHFAAESHVDRSIEGPRAFLETNVIGTFSLLQAAKSAWLDKGSGRPHRFHHISTDEVFGSLGAHDPAFTEATQYAPNSPYSASKAASDHLVRAWHHTYGLQVTTSNCSNNYGPWQFPEKLIPLFFLNALTGQPLPVYGDGLNVRDWLHVEDHCRGIQLVLNQGVVGETYNIGGGVELTNRQVVDAICATVDAAFIADPRLALRFPNAPAARGKPSAGLIRFVTDRLGHDRRYAVDASRITDQLGYVPQNDFTGGLARTFRWYLENEAWWRMALAQAERKRPAAPERKRA